jgi:myosin-1
MRRLGFKAGQIIGVLQQDDSGWWLAKIDGVVGWIPESYCSLVQ